MALKNDVKYSTELFYGIIEILAFWVTLTIHYCGSKTKMGKNCSTMLNFPITVVDIFFVIESTKIGLNIKPYGTILLMENSQKDMEFQCAIEWQSFDQVNFHFNIIQSKLTV